TIESWTGSASVSIGVGNAIGIYPNPSLNTLPATGGAISLRLISGTPTATLTLTITAASIPISSVQTTAKAASASASSLAVAFSAKTAAGDLILVSFDFNTTTPSSITDSQGNTFTEVGSQLTTPAGARSRVYYAPNIKGGADTITIKLAAKSSFLEVYLTEYSGVNKTSPIDVQAGASGSAGAVSSGSATTTATGDMIYGYCVGDYACTAGSGFTARSTLDSNLIEDQTAGSPGSYAATGSANNGWTMQMVALRPASAAAPALITRSTFSAGAETVAAKAPLPAAGGASSPVQNAVTGIDCSPRTVAAGGLATCELRLASVSGATAIQLTSSSAQVKLPSTVSSRSNQTRLTFQVAVDAAAREQSATITARTGSTTAEDTIQVQAPSGPVLSVPGPQTAQLGKALQFTVTAVDPAGLPVQLSAAHLPVGASFDAAGGRLEWTPSPSQAGRYKLTFGAANAAGQSSSAEVAVNANSGFPAVAASQQLVCSPGALASLSGSGFAEPASNLSDPSGRSLALAGTTVKINDQSVPLLAASEARVTFLCPALDPGTQLTAAVETKMGTSDSLTAPMQMATPMILSLDGATPNQGVISFAGNTDLATVRNYRVPGQPAQPGDEIVIWSSGLGSLAETDSRMLAVEVGGVETQVDSVQPIPDHAGVYAIHLRTPAVMDFGDAVPVQLRVTTPDGKQVAGNQVTLAVEAANQ
ncbi:MAG TPA: putative Ig domain-containing protein, partial [Verrucomicrobiae bacterium]|nr:putative Ig domain-containing protein [Verrucomicrobiae bacterium]